MLTTLSVIIWTGFLVAGCIIGWWARARHAVSEKAAINDGWREQLDAQVKEAARLELQGKTLKQQNSDLQNRSRELAETNRRQAESLERQEASRHELSQQLELANRRIADLESRDTNDREARLERELHKWQERLPPLIERYKLRDREAAKAEAEVFELRAELDRYRAQPSFDETLAGDMRPGDVDTSSDASNDTLTNAAPSLLEVKGIGPAINAKLGLLGISSLEQLANLSDDESERVIESVKGAQNKLPDWQAQARDLIGSGVNE